MIPYLSFDHDLVKRSRMILPEIAKTVNFFK